MYVWDWNEIVVGSGGWWLFLIAIAVLFMGFGIGYFVGSRPRAEVPGYWDDAP